MARKFLAKHPIRDRWFVVEELAGFGPQNARVSIRISSAKGGPGARETVSFCVTRADLLKISFDVMDVALQMVPTTTFATSEAVGSADGEPRLRHSAFVTDFQDPETIERRRRCVEGYRRLLARMPILQRAQRVLERCNTDTAEWLEDALTFMERQGIPPVMPTPATALLDAA